MSQPSSALRSLTALPVFNEVDSVDEVLNEVVRYSDDVLVVDDGSSDGTSERLAVRTDIELVTHEANKGYGAALITAFEFAISHKYDVVVTIDCDGQHEPQRIPRFVTACENADVDIVSGSRYLKQYDGDSEPPEQRMRVNRQITEMLNERLGFNLTDTFCGFKAYRVESLRKLELTETGYAMPLQLWVEAAAACLCVIELPVPLIYLDNTRSFGGDLDDASRRLAYYNRVIEDSVAATKARGLCRQSNCGE